MIFGIGNVAVGGSEGSFGVSGGVNETSFMTNEVSFVTSEAYLRSELAPKRVSVPS